MATGPYLSIITLSVNELTAPTKRHRVAEGIQKQVPYICCLQETPLRPQGHTQTESEGLEKDIPCKWKSKESWRNSTHIRQNRL